MQSVQIEEYSFRMNTAQQFRWKPMQKFFAAEAGLIWGTRIYRYHIFLYLQSATRYLFRFKYVQWN